LLHELLELFEPAI